MVVVDDAMLRWIPAAPLLAALAIGLSLSVLRRPLAPRIVTTVSCVAAFTPLVLSIVALSKLVFAPEGEDEFSRLGTANLAGEVLTTGGDALLAATQLTLDSTVFGWIDVPNTEAYYADGNSGLISTVWELITDGLDGADASVDFSDFDDGFHLCTNSCPYCSPGATGCELSADQEWFVNEFSVGSFVVEWDCRGATVTP